MLTDEIQLIDEHRRYLSLEQINRIKQKTAFNDEDIESHLKYYGMYDHSSDPGSTAGIDVDTILRMPELADNPLIPMVLQLFIDNKTKRITPEFFIFFCAILSSKMSVAAKKKLAFRMLDVHGSGRLYYAELFHLYKLLFDGAITDDDVLRAAVAAELQCGKGDLENPRGITYEDFDKVVSDFDIVEKLTVDLRLSSL